MQMDRRKFLVSAAAAAPALSISMSGVVGLAQDVGLPPVPELDAAKIKPSDFADAELDLPFALAHFARLANSVVLNGPDKGFIALSVWRGANQTKPYNARIMESILTLTWFYTATQGWNPYRGNPALRARLELALEFWCNEQSSDGKFSEYGPQQWNLAATSFAVKFMAESLRRLQHGAPIAEEIHQRTIDACRKALHAVLYDAELISHGREFSNQYTNIFAGGAAFLAMYPDAELQARLAEKAKASLTELQSPVGYMYESNGPDLGYTLNTHHENLRMAYTYWRGTPLGDLLVQSEDRFGKWLSYNALPQPGETFFVLNRGIETRQKHATYAHVDTPLADRCVILRAFATPPELRAQEIRTARAKLERQWPQVDPLPVGEFTALTPYLFLQRDNYDWHPTVEQMAEARKLVRPLAESSFTQQFKDTREPIVFTYVRRPTYYAAFASAPKVVSQQERLGLTMVWTPTKGVLLQSQTGGNETAWGTSTGVATPVEANGMEAVYTDGNDAVSYSLPGAGQKSVVFAQDRIHVTVERAGAIVERVPVFDPACVVSAAQRTLDEQPSSPVAGTTFTVVTLRGEGKLEYEIRPA
jgi:hypothetical protein